MIGGEGIDVPGALVIVTVCVVWLVLAVVAEATAPTRARNRAVRRARADYFADLARTRNRAAGGPAPQKLRAVPSPARPTPSDYSTRTYRTYGGIR